MNEDVITLDGILNSKIYIKEDSAISYGSPRQYIEPLLEKFKDIKDLTYRVAVSQRVANKESEGDVVNEAFGRVLVEAKFPNTYSICDHDSTIGLVYSLDTQKPTMKIYSGENAWACTNLSIFGAKYIHSVELLQGVNSIYDKSLEFVDGLTAQLARFQLIYQKMNDKIYKGEEINTIIGYLLRESYRNKQIGTSAILSALKDLEDNKSRYAIREDKTTQWNIYNATTQYCTDKVDIVDKATKTVMLANLFVND